jgi:hypothetical protein
MSPHHEISQRTATRVTLDVILLRTVERRDIKAEADTGGKLFKGHLVYTCNARRPSFAEIQHDFR